WYGTPGGFSRTIVATVEPNVRRGLRAMFPDWPPSKNPDEVAPQSESEPEEIGGFRGTARRHQGPIDNGGGRSVAEGRCPSRGPAAGRATTELRARTNSGGTAPAPGRPARGSGS